MTRKLRVRFGAELGQVPPDQDSGCQMDEVAELDRLSHRMVRLCYLIVAVYYFVDVSN